MKVTLSTGPKRRPFAKFELTDRAWKEFEKIAEKRGLSHGELIDDLICKGMARRQVFLSVPLAGVQFDAIAKLAERAKVDPGVCAAALALFALENRLDRPAQGREEVLSAIEQYVEPGALPGGVPSWLD